MLEIRRPVSVRAPVLRRALRRLTSICKIEVTCRAQELARIQAEYCAQDRIFMQVKPALAISARITSTYGSAKIVFRGLGMGRE